MIEAVRAADWYGVNWASILLRIALSILIGGTIGIERGIKRHPAGFRTYILVCLGSALVMMTNQYIVEVYGGDPGRLGAQVISGIGFLGAGTIIVTSSNQIRGLTTAASLWMAACLGVAIGIGFYGGALSGGIIVFLIMTVFQRFDSWVTSKNRVMKVCITFDGVLNFEEFLDQCREMDLKIGNIELSKGKSSKEKGIIAIVVLESAKRSDHTEIIASLNEIEGVRRLKEL